MTLRPVNSARDKGEAITSGQMYEIEKNAHRMGVLRVYMMENAGHGVADYVNSYFKKKSLDKIDVVAVCGTGNNGGDAVVAARHLSGYSHYRVSVILLGRPEDLRTTEAKINWKILNRIVSIESGHAVQMSRNLQKKISKASVIIDGIFGTGIRGLVREPHASAIRAINKSRALVIAVDIPSGLDPDTGEYGEDCVDADATVTFHRVKTGLLTAKKIAGIVHLEHIGIPKEAEKGILN